VRAIGLKKLSLPKVAVLGTGLAAAVMVATVSPAPVAQAHVGYTETCDGCHDVGGSVSATPSSATPAPGAAYTVALAFTGGTSPSGFWISGNGVNVTGSSSTSATMTAPAAAGTYTYTVWVRAGVVNHTTYAITVAAAPVTTTTPPVTTTTPPVTTTSTPPVDPTTNTSPVDPTTTPPVDPTASTSPVDPTTTPPVDPTTSTPPVDPTTSTLPVDPTTSTLPGDPTTSTPPESGASIGSLSPTHGVVGSTVTIAGSGFGTNATVQFGTAGAVELAGTISTDGKMVVSVPANMNSNFMPMTCVVTQKVWNKHARVVQVTVTPEGGSASIGVSFTMDSAKGYHKRDHEGARKGDHKGDHKGDYKKARH
jgi:hypothetical protein